MCEKKLPACLLGDFFDLDHHLKNLSDRYTLIHYGRPNDKVIDHTLVHPGGVRTNIAEASRKPRGTTEAQIAEQRQQWQRLLVLPPEAAAARILQGLERREPRVLVGTDAVLGAWMQRLFPVRYWQLMAKSLARRAGRAS